MALFGSLCTLCRDSFGLCVGCICSIFDSCSFGPSRNFFFWPGNCKHFPYTVILPSPPDTAHGSELLPVSVLNSRWGWVSSEGLKEAEPAPFVKVFISFLGQQAVEIEDRRIQSCVHFMTLKKLNRLAHIRLKKGRDQTHEVGAGRFNPVPSSLSPPP